MSAPLFEFRAFGADVAVLRFYPVHGKRLLDLLVLIALAPVALPLILLILGATALEGGQPLYSQMRVGQGGRLFRCWKVRTMVKDADRVLAEVLQTEPALAAEWRRNQKLARDPRITRLGAVLRRTSLDELPQLWNVLAGHMSLVGPRPFTPEQQEMYSASATDTAYYRLLPGITGLWQVSRRNLGSFGERAHYDSRYHASLGLITDLRILWNTAFVVLRATGL